jgi:hypothetical protein
MAPALACDLSSKARRYGNPKLIYPKTPPQA